MITVTLGELTASKKLAEAAKVIRSSPAGFRLRKLQTLERLSMEQSQHTIIVPFSKPKSSHEAVKLGMLGAASKDSSSAGIESMTKTMATNNQQLTDKMNKLNESVVATTADVRDKLSDAIDILRFVASKR